MSPTTRVRLLRHAPTPATRAHRFPGDEALDADGRAFAADLSPLEPRTRVVSASSRRCRQTARAVAPATEATVDARWDELHFGAWVGLTMEQVWEQDREGLQRWLDDPTIAPTDGESFMALTERVADALGSLRVAGGSTTVVTSAGPIKAAVLLALAAPPRAVWSVSIDPGSETVLEATGQLGWIVHGLNLPAASAFGLRGGRR